MKSKEFEFYVKADLSKYEGKYIAIVGDEVVASGSNAKDVLEEAKKKFPDKTPTLAKIPTQDTLIFTYNDIWTQYNKIINQSGGNSLSLVNN